MIKKRHLGRIAARIYQVLKHNNRVQKTKLAFFGQALKSICNPNDYGRFKQQFEEFSRGPLPFSASIKDNSLFFLDIYKFILL